MFVAVWYYGRGSFRLHEKGPRGQRRPQSHWRVATRLGRGRRRNAVGRRGVDAHLVATLALVLELHDAVDEGVDRVVRTQANVVARVPLGAALTNDDVAGYDALTAVLLHAAVLRIRIAAVAGGADALFMCH